MALTATIFRFEISLSDIDREVYETLELRVAQHPSETDTYLVTRVLARALEHRQGLDFGRGISVPEDPPLSALDERSNIDLWIEIGQPSADRLHKVTKRSEKVCVYTHKNPEPLLAQLGEESTVHRAEEIVVVALDADFIADLAGRLNRTNRWDILRSDGVLYVTVDDETFQTTPTVFDRREIA